MLSQKTIASILTVWPILCTCEIWFRTLRQTSTDPGMIKFCTLVPNIFNIIIAGAPSWPWNLYQLPCIEQKAPDNSEVHRSPQTVDPHYGTCFMSPIRHLIFGKRLQTCCKALRFQSRNNPHCTGPGYDGLFLITFRLWGKSNFSSDE
jgi:hypothetical protein